MKSIGLLTVSVLLFIAKAVMFGFVLVLLWEWFIVRSFTVAPLTFVQAVSAMFVSRFFLLKGHGSKSDKEDSEVNADYIIKDIGDAIKDIGHAIVYSAVILVLGWLLSLVLFLS